MLVSHCDIKGTPPLSSLYLLRSQLILILLLMISLVVSLLMSLIYGCLRMVGKLIL